MTTGRLPNIILIVVDTLRGDHVSCYGHERRTTPHLDALAADATLYTTALSPGAWTPPATPRFSPERIRLGTASIGAIPTSTVISRRSRNTSADAGTGPSASRP